VVPPLLGGLAQRSTLEQTIVLHLVLPHLGGLPSPADGGSYPYLEDAADRRLLLRFLLDVLLYTKGHGPAGLRASRPAQGRC